MSGASHPRFAEARHEIGRVLLALALALTVAFVLILVISAEPLVAMKSLLTGPLSSVRTIGLWIDDAAKLTMVGLALALVFQARRFSMVVQGQAFGNLAIGFGGNMSFEGILIAIVARSRPLVVPVVAIGCGYLRQGAALMGVRSDVPTEVISIVQAIVILLTASIFTVSGRKFWARVPGRGERREQSFSNCSGQCFRPPFS